MTIPEIAKKYGISEAYLNAKDDALQIEIGRAHV